LFWVVGCEQQHLPSIGREYPATNPREFHLTEMRAFLGHGTLMLKPGKPCTKGQWVNHQEGYQESEAGVLSQACARPLPFPFLRRKEPPPPLPNECSHLP
jgi:hypothetical protein